MDSSLLVIPPFFLFLVSIYAAKVSQVADCFCATDEDSGNKVCIPDNCDEAFGNRPVV